MIGIVSDICISMPHMTISTQLLKNITVSGGVDGAEDEVQNGAGEGSSGSVHGKRDSECCFVSHHQC